MTFPLPSGLRAGFALLALAAAGAGQEAPAPVADSWHFLAGAGVASQPKYPGSGQRLNTLLPMLSAFRGRYFIGGMPGAGLPAGVGAYLLQDGPWRAGVGLGANLRSPRREADSPRLHGLGDIHGTALGSLFGSYSWHALTARSAVVTDLGGQGQGTRVALDLEGRYSPVPRLKLTAGPGLTWDNGQYSQTFFGISGQQSASSGQAPWTAGSGIHTLRFALGADYQFGGAWDAWGVGAHLTLARLQGDAARSPVIESRSQDSFALFASYRF